MTDLSFFGGGRGVTSSPEPTMCKVAPRLGSSLWLEPREPRLPHALVVFLPPPSFTPDEDNAAESPGASPDG